MQELDFDDSVARDLRRYVQLVGRSVGLRGDSFNVHADDQAHAYIALEGRLPSFPDHDVALLWDENQGWAAAVEDLKGGDPQVVAHLGGEVLPPPEAVASWVRNLFRARPAPEFRARPAPEPVTTRLRLRTGPLHQLLAPYRAVLALDR